MNAFKGVTIFCVGLFVGHALGTVYGASLQKTIELQKEQLR